MTMVRVVEEDQLRENLSRDTGLLPLVAQGFFRKHFEPLAGKELEGCQLLEKIKEIVLDHTGDRQSADHFMSKIGRRLMVLMVCESWGNELVDALDLLDEVLDQIRGR